MEGAGNTVHLGHYNKNPPALQRQGGFFMLIYPLFDKYFYLSKSTLSVFQPPLNAKKNTHQTIAPQGFQDFMGGWNMEQPWGVSWYPPGPFQAPRQQSFSKGNFAPAGAPRAALERAPWTPRNFLLSPRSKQEPPPMGRQLRCTAYSVSLRQG